MPLYSTETQANAGVGKLSKGSEHIPGPEVEICSQTEGTPSWCYLFIHHAKVNAVCRILEKHYQVFIHKRIVYKRENKRILKEEQPTVSGLIFIQGSGRRVQELLTSYFPGLSLARDCSTYQIAVIPDSIMQPFMQVSEVAPTRIRFMPHAFDYYCTGNPLVRITSGILTGLEGYRIRIARDKCLITSVGGMTVAIGGIYRESFENLDEYVRQRREQLKGEKVVFTPLQRDIDSCFFTPQNQLDVVAMTEAIAPWLMKMDSCLDNKDFDGAVEIALFVLEEIGSRFQPLHNNSKLGNMKGILDICRAADKVLLSVMGSKDVSTDLKEIVETGRESLAVRFPLLPIGL